MLFALKLRLLRARAFDIAPLEVNDELAGLVQAGGSDRRALRTLLTALGPSMLQVIRRVLGARHPDIEDVLQEATIALVRALPTFRGQASARHFACRIASFTAISALRRQRRAGRAARALPSEDAEAGVGPEADAVVTARRRDVLRALLAELPETQAEALVLHCIAGLTVDEVGRSMGTPLETARSRLRLAKAALRARIEEDPVAAELLEGQP